MTLAELIKFAEENKLSRDTEIMVSLEGLFSTSVTVEVAEYRGKRFIDLTERRR